LRPLYNRSERLNDKAHGEQQSDCTWVHENCEQRATPYLGGAVGCTEVYFFSPVTERESLRDIEIFQRRCDGIITVSLKN